MINTCLFFFISICLVFFSPKAQAGPVVIFGAPGGDITVNVTSHKEARFITTINQKYDFSCGSAALATLLTYHYADPVTEEEIFESMYYAGNQEKIRAEGFSLLDIKNYLRRRGYESDGFRTTLDKLQEAGVPAIVLINYNGYKHFVVIKGISSTEVLLGDPSNGVRRMTRTQFEPMWGGLLFLIRNNQEIANMYFNQENDWKINPRAPLRFALRPQELGNITWMLPGKNDF